MEQSKINFMRVQEILSFIDLIRSSVPNAIEVFTEGNCGSFSRMLLYAFPEGRIMYLQPRHFVFEYEHSIYDITGCVNKEYDYKKLIYLEDVGDINTLICELTPRYK